MIMNILINLVGEQAAPVLIPTYELSPDRVILVASNTTNEIAKRLKELFIFKKGIEYVDIVIIDPYNPITIVNELRDVTGIDHNQKLVGNFTSGTKLMAIALQKYLMDAPGDKHQLVYLHTKGSKGDLHFLDPQTLEPSGTPIPVQKSVSLEDYIWAYWGRNTPKGKPKPAKNDGEFFENAIFAALSPCVEDIWSNIRPEKNSPLEIDFIIRCGNIVGVIETKYSKQKVQSDTSNDKKRRKSPKRGIDQLNTAAKNLGAHVRKFLIINEPWTGRSKNLIDFAEDMGITVIGLPSYSKTNKTISEEDRKKLVSTIREELRCQGDVEC